VTSSPSPPGGETSVTAGEPSHSEDPDSTNERSDTAGASISSLYCLYTYRKCLAHSLIKYIIYIFIYILSEHVMAL